ncbi:MAG: phosphatase PAP2 family protein [Deinococcus sp.]|nr:phosphatase PAP2 family protein [Deinococcus sp.]
MEYDVIRLVQHLSVPWLDQVMTMITNLGSEYLYIAALALVYWLWDREVGYHLAVLMVTSFLVNFGVKELVAAPRPSPELVRIIAPQTAAGYGFPSGHAQSSATFWWYLALVSRRWWLWVGGTLLVLLVAFSRVYLGVHFLDDVVGGVVLGAVLAGVGPWVAGVTLPALSRPVALGLKAVLPALGLLLPVTDSARLLGLLAGVLVGGDLVRFQLETRGRWWQLVLRAVLGLVVVFGVWFLSRLLFPEGVLQYLRYFLIGLAAMALVPVLFRLVRLA